MVHISLSSSVKVEASVWIEPLEDHSVIDEHQSKVIFWMSVLHHQMSCKTTLAVYVIRQHK